LAGLIESYPDLRSVTPTDPTKETIFQCVYTVVFSDGTKFAGAADSNWASNNVEPFCNYPTSIAESRAEARAIRKALGITILSTEEIGFDAKSRRIDPQQISVISHIIKKNNLNVRDTLDVVLGEAAALRISSLESLSEEDGARIMKYLNELKKKGNK
jgi:hypothetical protein